MERSRWALGALLASGVVDRSGAQQEGRSAWMPTSWPDGPVIDGPARRFVRFDRCVHGSAVGQLVEFEVGHDVGVIGVVMQDVVLHLVVVDEAKLAVWALTRCIFHGSIVAPTRARR